MGQWERCGVREENQGKVALYEISWAGKQALGCEMEEKWPMVNGWMLCRGGKDDE